MKLLIRPDEKYAEELTAIANGFVLNGIQTLYDNTPVYLAKPDVIFTTVNTTSNDIINYCREGKGKLCIFTNTDLDIIGVDKYLKFSQKNLPNCVNLGRFANTIKYGFQIPENNLDIDILVITNGINTLDCFTPLIKEKKIILAGETFIESPCFIGLTNTQELVKIAQNSKVVYTSNSVIRDSLILQNVFTLDISEFNPHNELDEERLVNEKKDIKTEKEIAKIIYEELGHFYS